MLPHWEKLFWTRAALDQTHSTLWFFQIRAPIHEAYKALDISQNHDWWQSDVEVPVEVIKEVLIEKEIIVEKPVTLEKIVKVPVEIIKEVSVEVERFKPPKWSLIMMAVELAAIIMLLLK